jgi:4-amino-4-deoxy-L-arabinose transferase-like glycosyltransferase
LSRSARSRPPFLLLCIVLLLYFWANGLAGLDRYPKIYQDESWIAAPGYTFWTEGYFGTDLFKGFYGSEQHYYTIVPVFPLLVGGSLRLFGLGLFQVRLVPLALSMLTLALTYRLGAQLFSRWHGLLAVVILVSWRIAAPIYYLPTGIPLADMARIVRYDIAVPVFALAALSILVGKHSQFLNHSSSRSASALSTRPNTVRTHSALPFQSSVLSPQSSLPSSLRFFASGLMIGLATLSHYYGAFWFPALVLAAFWCWGWNALRRLAWMGIGLILPLIPWALFALSGWDDYRAQFRQFASRFGMFDPQFYLTNLSAEIQRYQPLVNGAQKQVGTWLAVLMFAVGLIWLGRDTTFRKQKSAGILLICIMVIAGLFALLVNLKTFTYLGTLWPLYALTASAGFLSLWNLTWQKGILKRQELSSPLGVRGGVGGGVINPTRILLAILFVLAVWEGLRAEIRIRTLAQTTTPYAQFTAEIASYLPAGSKVLGMPDFWLGLPRQEYTCILVPIDWTNPHYVADPLTFGEAAQRLRPDFILFDQTMLNLMQETGNPNSDLYPLNQQISEYLREQGAFLAARLYDRTYGWLEIYRLAGNFPPTDLDSLG